MGIDGLPYETNENEIKWAGEGDVREDQIIAY